MRDIDADFEYGYYTASYSGVISSFEVEVLVEVDDDDYQGDSRYLLRDGSRYGVLVFGWGSCSGCDALQACSNLQDVTELRDDLWNSIHWEDSREAMAEYIADKDWGLEWYGRTEKNDEFVREASAVLSAVSA